MISKRVGSPVFDFNQMKAACEDWEDGYIELGKFTGACDIEYTMLDVSRARGWQWILAGTLAVVDGFAIMLASLIIGYAAAFGISDRVAAEFTKAYPQVNDPRWLDDNASDSGGGSFGGR